MSSRLEVTRNHNRRWDGIRARSEVWTEYGSISRHVGSLLELGIKKASWRKRHLSQVSRNE